MVYCIKSIPNLKLQESIILYTGKFKLFKRKGADAILKNTQSYIYCIDIILRAKTVKPAFIGL
jgi:hypothetical protein